MTIYQRGAIRVEATLPEGPVDRALAVADGISNILHLPSGRTLATTETETSPYRTVLHELLPDGSLRQIGLLEAPPIPFTRAIVRDLALDSRGRVFLLLYDYTEFPHGGGITRLVEIDPATAATLDAKRVADFASIATAPAGFWAADFGGRLSWLDPDSGAASPAGLTIDAPGLVLQIEADSAGRLWYASRPSGNPPPRTTLGFFDPATGAATPAPEAFSVQTPRLQEIAIRRACADSPTSRCLQDGRFRAEIAYRAYDGAAGPAQVAPARSADTAVFSFFDPANWELMVKVLDGCAINERFWVYSSASTDVEYTMTITDTQTGLQKVYSNPLGQIALTVTDNQAFPCSP